MSSETFQKVACLGGIYSNYLALENAILDAKARGAEQIFCLGDLGAFGPFPDRIFPLIHQHDVICIQGNYDDSIGNELDDCQCGYLDPRDNHFAQISYDYTRANTSSDNKQFLRGLPKSIGLNIGGHRTLLCHGSPRRVNEFLWESTTSTQFINRLLCENDVDLIVGTHTGIKWQRACESGKFVNAGVLGRPENDGTQNVWYTMIEATDNELQVDFIPVEFDSPRLASEMRDEDLPEEFVNTILTGWWTTCLEILPSKERRQGVA